MDELAAALLLFGVASPHPATAKSRPLPKPQMSLRLRADLRRFGVKPEQMRHLEQLVLFGPLARSQPQARLNDVRHHLVRVRDSSNALARSLRALTLDTPAAREARRAILGGFDDLRETAVNLATLLRTAEYGADRARVTLRGLRTHQTRSKSSAVLLISWIDQALRQGWDEWVSANPDERCAEKVDYPFSVSRAARSPFRQVAESLLTEFIATGELANAEGPIKQYIARRRSAVRVLAPPPGPLLPLQVRWRRL